MKTNFLKNKFKLLITLCSVGTVAILLLATANINADSLYQQDSYRSLVQDLKASRVGDTVTLLVVENSQAKASADTAVSSGMELGGSIGKSNSTESGSISAQIGHQGGGATAREANFRAKITVMVKEKDAQGKLFVEGKQTITVNGDKQVISASGWLRSEDIAPDNTALSTRLSDSKIEYSGKGLLERERKPGFFNWLAKKLRIV